MSPSEPSGRPGTPLDPQLPPRPLRSPGGVEEKTSAPCPPCVAYHGDEFAREIGECDRHHAAVQALARQLASLFQGTDEPSIDQVGWFMEDATEVAETWEPSRTAAVIDLGDQRDGRRHLTVDGERWATPDPNAEGFCPIAAMTACTHPYLPAEDDPDAWSFDDEDTPCELCHGTGWTSYTPAELAEANIGDSGAQDATRAQVGPVSPRGTE